MDKRAKRAYDKAINYYEKGRINKALGLCEEILSEGLDNPLVLNFKGLLLYQKGNLNEAVAVWRINKDINRDSIAKNYMKDVIADEERLEIYKQGEKALKQLKIDKALELFKQCAESDFNSIKVNTGIAICYQKKGEFIKAKEYIDKALSIDEDAVTAKIIKKELKESGIYRDSQKFFKNIIAGIVILLLFSAIGIVGYLNISKYKNNNMANNVQEEKDSVVQEQNNEEGAKEKKNTEEAQEPSSESTTKSEVSDLHFDREKLKILITNNDLDGVYEQVNNIKKESIGSDDIEVYNKAIDLMKNQGVSKFYEYGLWYFNQGNYSVAKSYLDKAYAYCEGNGLKEHVLFYRASNSSKEQDNKSALAQFEEYYKQYHKGVYVQEALYELSLLSNAIDKEKSKFYANILMRDYSNSIYANDNIKNILKS